METPPLGRLKHYLAGVTDNRQAWKVRHPLTSVLFIAVVGTIANGGSWEEIEQFGKGKESWFRQYVDLPWGAPSHDTFERVFRWIDGKEFERSFILWMREICQDKELGIVAIDGKTMRGSGDKTTERSPLHIVSAWSSANNLVLGQVKTDEKSNEITAIPALLDLLDVKGSIVTIDAMGTQKEIAAKIIQKKADYVLNVKKNQPRLYEDIQYFIEEESKSQFNEVEHEYSRTLDKGHGRIEKREYYLFNEIEWLSWKKEWKNLGGFGMVRRQISDTKGNFLHEEQAYFITSLKSNVNNFAEAVRAHWGIEAMHWSLDVVLNEDRRTVRKDNGAQNLAVLKRMALNILRANATEKKMTGPQKRFRACWDEDYMGSVLRDM
jgi:predicted transposase YbfD/YdcC